MFRHCPALPACAAGSGARRTRRVRADSRCRSRRKSPRRQSAGSKGHANLLFSCFIHPGRVPTRTSHDLDIRGDGKSAGRGAVRHIKEVGFGFYQQRREEAVASPRPASSSRWPTAGRRRFHDRTPCSSRRIFTWRDLPVRLSLYRRLANSDEARHRTRRGEMRDRFGRWPDEVKHLLATVVLKGALPPRDVARFENRA